MKFLYLTLLTTIQMVLPEVLKKRHSLKGCNLVPLIKRIRLGQPTSLKEYARVQKDKKTEGFTLEEIQNNFKDITGETVEDILIMAQRDETLEEARRALHAAIIYANEVGQPRGQELVNPSSSNSMACNDLVASDEQNQQIPIKRKRDMVTESLEDRVASLEKTKKVELVDDLKDKVSSEETNTVEVIGACINGFEVNILLSDNSDFPVPLNMVEAAVTNIEDIEKNIQ